MKTSIQQGVIAEQPFNIALSETNFKTSDFPTRALELGFVDLGSDNRPKSNKRYSILSAGDEKLNSLTIPNTTYKKLDIDLYFFLRRRPP
ncbi:hypothetical protein [Aestuariibaculum sediminum]|uniref:Uncharacterized protein n=1 Tax=Aestuariibaculum sediminum TaxID=2770637 RepID=A0A8J6QAB6_9FLAO|nr:hypothetical protein [Aestuariibaculum sediminum]MBD0833277.1 hypothetical protein [Aestuariibaculum sediminum]